MAVRPTVVRSTRRSAWLTPSLVAILGFAVFAHPVAGQTPFKLGVAVLDENRVPVAGARLTLTHIANQEVTRGETDHAGRREFAELAAGAYAVRAE